MNNMVREEVSFRTGSDITASVDSINHYYVNRLHNQTGEAMQPKGCFSRHPVAVILLENNVVAYCYPIYQQFLTTLRVETISSLFLICDICA